MASPCSASSRSRSASWVSSVARASTSARAANSSSGTVVSFRAASAVFLAAWASTLVWSRAATKPSTPNTRLRCARRSRPRVSVNTVLLCSIARRARKAGSAPYSSTSSASRPSGRVASPSTSTAAVAARRFEPYGRVTCRKRPLGSSTSTDADVSPACETRAAPSLAGGTAPNSANRAPSTIDDFPTPFGATTKVAPGRNSRSRCS